MMPCGWEGNRRSGVTLAMRHRPKWFIHLWTHGLRNEHEHFSYTPHGIWQSLHFSWIEPNQCLISFRHIDVVCNIDVANWNETLVEWAIGGPEAEIEWRRNLIDCAAGGEVYVWDMQRRTCCHKFVDDGCGTLGTSLAVSTGNQYLAAG